MDARAVGKCPLCGAQLREVAGDDPRRLKALDQHFRGGCRARHVA